MMLRKPKDIIIKGKTLEQLLDEHAEWLYNMNPIQPIWGDLINADLSYADLEHVNLSRASLHGVNLKHANLTYANLDNVDLSCANLEDSDLNYINLYNANLTKANLNWASLYGADLQFANLNFSSLKNADLRFANLTGADLKNAYLRGVHLDGADLRGVHLDGADLEGAEFNYSNLVHAYLDGAKGNLIEYRKGKILTEDIIGYKVCGRDFYNIEQQPLSAKRVLVTLKIPRGAIVFSINGNKCRTNRAKVIAIEGADRAYSTYKYMSYYVGDEFNIYNFNCQYNMGCGEGIHFFMTREEALKHTY